MCRVGCLISKQGSIKLNFGVHDDDKEDNDDDDDNEGNVDDFSGVCEGVLAGVLNKCFLTCSNCC